MRYVTTALVVAVLILSVQLHSAKERIAVLEDRSTVYSKHDDNFEQFLGFVQQLIEDICVDLKIDPSTRVSNLTNDEVAQIRKYIEANFRVEGDLRRDVSQNIRRKTEIGTYQGLRHRMGLPVRGQRTHTNARTRKGPRFAIAGKKKATK